jgi:hypothetical protein
MADNSLGAKVGSPVVVPVITAPTSVTMTANLTNTSVTATETRIGEVASYRVLVTFSGAPSAGNLVVSLPSGRTINTSLLPLSSTSAGSANPLPGSSGSFYDLSAPVGYPLQVGYSTTTAVIPFIWDDAATGVVNQNNINATSPVTVATGDSVVLNFSVPILEWAGSANVAYGAGLATSVKAGLIKSYDEGTFTPILTSTGGGTSTTYSTQVGTYTKLGRLVHFSLRIDSSVFSASGSGNVAVAGLPFTPLSTANYQSLTVGYSANFATNNPSSAILNAGTGQIELEYRATANGVSTVLPASAYQSGAVVMISGTYQAAS